MDKILAVAAGSVVGGLGRHALTLRAFSWAGPAFPLGTLAVNVSGCFLIGALDAWGTARGTLGPNARLLLMTGFCGAYTTFSTLILDSARLSDAGQLSLGLANYMGSGVLGLLAFRLGARLAGVL
ncbi:MAG: CrcB protein [Elusimicrobia bacterium]|nr:MAG: CrcB protein [Elusimicrobiota bacterium]